MDFLLVACKSEEIKLILSPTILSFFLGFLSCCSLAERVNLQQVYLLLASSMVAHVPLQLRAIGEGVAAVGAAVVVLTGLVAIFNVFLQRGVAFVTPGTVRAGVQLGEGVRCACGRGTRQRSLMTNFCFGLILNHVQTH